MGKSKNISSEKVAQIVVLHNQGLKPRVISNTLHVNQSIVSRALSRFKETGSYSHKKNRGSPRITSKQTDRLIHRMVVETPTCSSSEIQSRLPSPDRVSRRTIRRRLQVDFKLRSDFPAKKPNLSPKNVKDRLLFAHKYKDWTLDQWCKTEFSDETSIKQFYACNSRVRRPVGERYNNRYITPRVKMSPSVMIWGSISGQGRGGLWFMPQNTMINAAVYLQILKEMLPHFMLVHSCTHFQQDGAPCHTARVAKAWISEQGIELINLWPGSSLDLNPIENCWAIVKKKVSFYKPTSTKDLIEKIKQVWCREITPEYCEGLLHSMPARIAAVLAAKGGLTKY
jgi:transposase